MIAILPAAGRAERMNGLPKFLLPLPTGDTLIAAMLKRVQGVVPRLTVIGTRDEHYERLCAHTNGAHVYRANTATMSETVLAARRYQWDGEWTLFGMPDTYIPDDDIFGRLDEALHAGADVAAACFETRPEQRRKLGMCAIQDRRVIGVVDKPLDTHLSFAWIALAWKQAFWQYIDAADPHVGYALPRAIEAGLNVTAVRIWGDCYDCGTPAEYFACIRALDHQTKEPVYAHS